MRIVHHRITLFHIDRPHYDNVNAELQWFGSTLGLFGLRDKNKSCFRIFIELVKSLKNADSISSDELAYRLDLSRGTVIHHINHLIESGIVAKTSEGYTLRVKNLKMLVEEIEKDMQRSINDLKTMADKLDGQLGL